jgi:zinc protease
MAYKMPTGLDADSDALDVLTHILTSGKDSRLYRTLTDAGLTTSVYSTPSRLRDPGLAYVLAFLAPDHTHSEVEAVLLDEIGRLTERGVEEREIERARRQMTAGVAFGRDGSFAVASQLNEAIASGDWRLYAEYLDRINAVSADDVRRVASTYLTSDRRTVGWYLPTEAS